MSHIILINSERDQVETHKVDRDKFLQVWDLLHERATDDVLDGLAFGAAARVPEIQEAMREAINTSPTVHPASDPVADAMANSTFEEPELEPVIEMGTQYVPGHKSESEVIQEQDSDAAFLNSLQALMG